MKKLLLIVGVVLLQVVFSGGVLPLSDLGPLGHVLGAVATDHWAFTGLTAAVGIDGAGCSAESLANCTLPGFGAYATEAERAVAFMPIDEQYGDIIGVELWLSFAALAAITAGSIAVMYWRLRAR